METYVKITPNRQLGLGTHTGRRLPPQRVHARLAAKEGRGSVFVKRKAQGGGGDSTHTQGSIAVWGREMA